MPGLSENSTYQNLIGGAYSLGNTLKKAVPDLSNLKNTLKDTASGVKTSVINTTAGVPKSLSSLGRITTNYGGSTRSEKFHRGIDIAAPKGTPMPALTPGMVTEVGTASNAKTNPYGNYVVIKDPQGNYIKYSHLNNSYVKVGTAIVKGANIGEIGNTGNVYSPSGKGDGSHLDLRIYNYAKSHYYNPLEYLR
jgi:murein DD-endopeptidase MepM/ murein hydrolase activator NlpD